MPSGVYAAIFDLDGVLTSTSARHEQSWADAARAFNIPVTEAALRATRSIPRASSLAALLAHAGVPLPSIDRDAVMAFKNQRYKELIAGLQPTDAFAGARTALERCRALGARTAVASASLNAREVLDRLALLPLVDFVADPSRAEPKPSAEIYGMACAALGALQQNAVCIEDGAPMIANLRAEGLYTVGIGVEPLGADEQFTTIAEWDVSATFGRRDLRA
jgi:HAD superfamily hydrolase (TIGR01509 family)